MIKEDLTGKLLQRAEAIAQREEYEEIIENSALNSLEFELFSRLSKEKQRLLETNEEKSRISKEIERKNEEFRVFSLEINENKDQLLGISSKLKELSNEIPAKIAKNNDFNRESEKNLEILAKSNKIPEFIAIFEFLASKTGFFLDYVLLSRQFSIIESEEASFMDFMDNELKVLEEKARNPLEKQTFPRKKRDLLRKKDERLEDIAKWKEKAQEKLSKSPILAENLRKSYNFEAFDKILSEIHGNPEEINDFKELCWDFFSGLETQEAECNISLKKAFILLRNLVRELEKVQSILLKEQVILEESLIPMKENWLLLREKLENLEKMLLSHEKTAISHFETIKELEKGLEKALLDLTEDAFGDYMAEQAETFDRISKTYGKSVI